MKKNNIIHSIVNFTYTLTWFFFVLSIWVYASSLNKIIVNRILIMLLYSAAIFIFFISLKVFVIIGKNFNEPFHPKYSEIKSAIIDKNPNWINILFVVTGIFLVMNWFTFMYFELIIMDASFNYINMGLLGHLPFFFSFGIFTLRSFYKKITPR